MNVNTDSRRGKEWEQEMYVVVKEVAGLRFCVEARGGKGNPVLKKQEPKMCPTRTGQTLSRMDEA